MSSKGDTLDTEAAIQTFGDQTLAPGAYCLGGDALECFTFNLKWESYQEDCNLGKTLDRLIGASPKALGFMEPRDPEGEIFVLGENEVKVAGSSHALRILRELLGLTCKGVKPRDATWFYYDHTPEKHCFFVVHAGKIVDDCYSFLNGFPRILAGGLGWEAPEFGWYDHPGFEEAFELYWYRKFYTETFAGQLMVLSPHKPLLYHYARETEERTQTPTPELLARTSLVVIPILAAIAFPSLRPYFAIAATVLSVPWAFACWRILRTKNSRGHGERED